MAPVFRKIPVLLFAWHCCFVSCNGESDFGGKLRRFEANEIIIARFLENYPSVLSRAEQRSGLARFYCRKARHCASAGERIAAFEAIISAFKNSPLDAIVWRALYRTLVPRK